MIFEMRNIVKMYDNLCANDNVSLHLNRGEILAIVGENGAGKSTIMKILYGLVKPTSGEIYVNGKHMHFAPPPTRWPRASAWCSSTSCSSSR